MEEREPVRAVGKIHVVLAGAPAQQGLAVATTPADELLEERDPPLGVPTRRIGDLFFDPLAISTTCLAVTRYARAYLGPLPGTRASVYVITLST